MAQQTFISIQLLLIYFIYFINFCIYTKIAMKANFLGLDTTLNANFEMLTIFWPKYFWTVPLDSECMNIFSIMKSSLISHNLCCYPWSIEKFIFSFHNLKLIWVCPLKSFKKSSGRKTQTKNRNIPTVL